MRPPTLLLLLMCLLIAVVDASTPCDLSLITGVTPDQIHFCKANKTLTCADVDGHPMAVKVVDHNLLHANLKCNKTGGWTGKAQSGAGEYYVEYTPDAITPLKIVCVKACLFQPLESGVQPQFNKTTLTLTCNRSERFLTAMKITSGPPTPKLFESLTCDHDSGMWMSGDAKITSAFEILNVSCDNYCAVTSPKLTVRTQDGRLKVSCAGQGVYKLLHHEGRAVGPLTCSPSEGWLMGGNSITPLINTVASQPVRLECRAPPCSLARSDRTWWDHSRADTGGRLRCEADSTTTRKSLSAIEVKGKIYASLTCDEVEGWKDGNTTIADASVPLDIFCHKFCSATTSPTAVNGQSGVEEILYTTLSKHSDSIEAACINREFELISNQRHVRGNFVRCSREDGWMGSGVKIEMDPYAPQHFECRPPPLPCTFEEHIVNDFTVLTMRFDAETNKSTLRCRSEGDVANEIEFLSNRYASLECDEIEGWKDGHITIAGAHSRPRLTCVTVISQTTADASLSSTESTPKRDPTSTTTSLPPYKLTTSEAESRTSSMLICGAVGVCFFFIVIICGICLLVFMMNKRRNSENENGNDDIQAESSRSSPL